MSAIRHCRVLCLGVVIITVLVSITDAAGNFLCPATALSFNAFKTVLDIDTLGTFNTSKVVYEKWFKVRRSFCLCDAVFLSCAERATSTVVNALSATTSKPSIRLFSCNTC